MRRFPSQSVLVIVLLLFMNACGGGASHTCTGLCDQNPPSGSCGDGIVQSSEQCDLGSQNGQLNAACDAACHTVTSASGGCGYYRYFTGNDFWCQSVAGLQPDPKSSTLIAKSINFGGNALRITGVEEDSQYGTVGFRVMHIHHENSQVSIPIGDTAILYLYTPSADAYYDPQAPANTQETDANVLLPIPSVGSLEGSPNNNYTCDVSNEDCHLLVDIQFSQTDMQGAKPPPYARALYEMWRADVTDVSALSGGLLAVWNQDQAYGPSGRGENCSSADAAGYPIAPLLFSADEVYVATQKSEGDLGHAIRFTLPNDRIAGSPGNHFYVHPATHTSFLASGGPDALPYGAHLRLKNSVKTDNLSPGAAVMVRTLQKYGMFLADGGNIALTAENDIYNAHKWSESAIGLEASSLAFLQLSDFEVMPTGTAIAYTGDCTRTSVLSQ